jgi:hypothetical protein
MRFDALSIREWRVVWMAGLEPSVNAIRICEDSSTTAADFSLSRQGVVERALSTSPMYWFGWPKTLRRISSLSEWSCCGGRITLGFGRTSLLRVLSWLGCLVGLKNLRYRSEPLDLEYLYMHSPSSP